MVIPTTIFLFIGSLVLYLAAFILVGKEQKRGSRIFLKDMRSRLDVGLSRLEERLIDIWHHFTEYIVKLGWYYSVHSFLRTSMNFLVSTYDYFEDKLEKNRDQALKLRAERRKRESDKQSHLLDIADHKNETALSDFEKAALKQKALEED